ncbi:DnaJ-like chaperone [Komagataella phaffii]|uniref:One of several homologs of bacterial chaperone DnaJ, located in the ER lumen n=1 Tax=Komagataella phaffii (strain GS115 / ATCC 20864) TaxID=644223 RepID=C4R348_KOMPG|nr:One of several homologs of bacterial chaperone DnaJ, located in the ER lumen [Komagataella phaffii GS115]AOA61994.1 GQ67_01344T0 [Komagataella phaffii]AOA66965.1 GQ68_00046T0 [Komagataella phaffii GS115]CAH2447514.1 DnaJ homolog subfamily C member 27 [Komagataella phaffii CBS 7435]CAY69922.1 One of several homologs of bacterial chaperone DnaJ, located in the ER lumen [Komagataella phaffii GS115]
MRLNYLFFIAVALNQAVHASSIQSFSQKIDSLSQQFSQFGPTSSISKEYDNLLDELLIYRHHVNDPNESNEIDSMLSNLYYTKGLIDLSFTKEISSSEMFRKCLEYGPSRKACRDKMVESYIKQAKFKDLEEILGSAQLDSAVFDQKNNFNHLVSQAEKTVVKKNFKDSVATLSKLREISPLCDEIRYLRIYCVINLQDIPYQSKLDMLLEDYVALAQNGKYSSSPRELKIFNPKLKKLFKGEDDLDVLINLYKLRLFGKSNFSQASKMLQKCLRIDNDYKAAQLYTKVNVKLAHAFELFDKALLYISAVDSEDEGTSITESQLSSKEWISLYEFLLNPEKLIKLKPKQIAQLGYEKKGLGLNNFDFLLKLGYDFSKDFKFKEDGELLKQNLLKNNLERVLVESMAQSNNFARHKKLLMKICQDKTPRPLACEIPKLDYLISTNTDSNIRQAYEILNRYSKVTKKTHLWKQRYSRVEKVIQQQRQQQQQQQQQFRQPPQQKVTPKNDYYKILDVSRDADEKTIKKAFRRKIKEFHPDKYKGDLESHELEDKMAEINNAYEVLSNEKAREKYDKYGEDPNDPAASHSQHQQHQQHQQHHYYNPNVFHQQGFQFGGFNFGGFNKGHR